jgi:uncharacterized protein YdcH (DUF465 family)
MDAIHYDKIADKLVNFHSKLPDIEDLEDKSAKLNVTALKKQVLQLLCDIDIMAAMDNDGWIR